MPNGTGAEAVDVLELEPGLHLAVGDDDTPLLRFRLAEGETLPLLALAVHLDVFRLRAWHERVDAWLRNRSNDCLRARGDLRWLAACRAEMVLRV